MIDQRFHCFKIPEAPYLRTNASLIDISQPSSGSAAS